MSIIASYILPHGALCLNPNKYPELKNLPIINKSYMNVAEEIYYSKPDIIILTTPHGISLNSCYGIYCNSSASGSAEWLGDYKDYTVKVDLAQDESQELLSILQNKKIPTEGICAYAEDEILPLRWGEAIPIWFISQPYLMYTLKSIPIPKFLIISMPRKRISDPESMINDCLDIGKEIYDFVNTNQLIKNKKCIVITSGDMAHTHITLPQNSSITTLNCCKNLIFDEADFFDKNIELWASNPINNENILFDMAKPELTYLSCGYTGFIIQQGIFREITKNSKNMNIKPTILCNEHPTYYGMMVVKFNFN